jgi:hypothetical protein
MVERKAANSTSWGSLVRAQYRPSRKPLRPFRQPSRAGFTAKLAFAVGRARGGSRHERSALRICHRRRSRARGQPGCPHEHGQLCLSFENGFEALEVFAVGATHCDGEHRSRELRAADRSPQDPRSRSSPASSAANFHTPTRSVGSPRYAASSWWRRRRRLARCGSRKQQCAPSRCRETAQTDSWRRSGDDLRPTSTLQFAPPRHHGIICHPKREFEHSMSSRAIWPVVDGITATAISATRTNPTSDYASSRPSWTQWVADRRTKGRPSLLLP